MKNSDSSGNGGDKLEIQDNELEKFAVFDKH